jgi:hypothetical protein
MKSNDLGGWISALLALIALAYGMGQEKKLHDFALRQAAHALIMRPSEHFLKPHLSYHEDRGYARRGHISLKLLTKGHGTLGALINT